MRSLLVLAALASLCARAEPAVTVVTLYNQVPLGRWEVLHTARGWEVGGGHARAVVDEPNGYLSISDSGTGGGIVWEEAALFVARSGARQLIVVSSSTGPDCWQETHRVFDVHGADVELAKTDPLAEISLASFARPGCKPDQFDDLMPMLEKLTPMFMMPRNGTAIIAALNFDAFHTEVFARHQDDADPNKAANRAVARLKKCYATGRQVDFDPQTGKFHLGRLLEHPVDESMSEAFYGKLLPSR